jgi:TM2 domain-containing membrane protein YozV
MLPGITVAVLAYLGLLPAELNVRTDRGILAANTVWLWVGIFVTIVGFLMMLLARERYAVRIGTAEGEKNAIVSRKREYIAQIVDAVHSAFDLGSLAPPMAGGKP